MRDGELLWNLDEHAKPWSKDAPLKAPIDEVLRAAASRIRELSGAVQVSEKCLTSIANELYQHGFDKSAAGAKKVAGIMSDILKIGKEG